MILHVLEAIAGAVAVFGLGWAGGLRWERAGREVDRLIEEETAELRAIPHVRSHDPQWIYQPANPLPPQVVQLPRVVLVPGPQPVLPPPGPSPIFDQLAAEFERRAPDPALAASLAAVAEFTAGLDAWADNALALVRDAE